MKISIAFLMPYRNTGIGGWDRKFEIYFKNLDERYFDKHALYIADRLPPDEIESRSGRVFLPSEIIGFLKQHDIAYVYFAGAKLTPEVQESIVWQCVGIINVNFTPTYRADQRFLNFIISKTDYWKLRWMRGDLVNAHVVYNPIDFQLWTELVGRIDQWDYRDRFVNKKRIVGRLARAEPSKWHFLILATLWRLDRKRNYDNGFLFAGMPWIYRLAIRVLLSRRMQDSIVFLPELRSHEDIARFYRSIDIFWQTSWIGESFGNVIAEAFCFGVPVITDFKHFYRDSKVYEYIYDAQIELVDHKQNGVYCAVPSAVVDFLEHVTTEDIYRMGLGGYEKVRDVYDVRLTSDTMAKILYEYGRQHLWFPEDSVLSVLRQNPDVEEVTRYEREYAERINIGLSLNRATIWYVLGEKIWRIVEYGYLVIRKCALSVFDYNIEKH